MTLQLLQTTIYDYLEERSMLSVVASHVKPSALLESDWDSQKLEELCSLKLLDSPKKSNHNIYSLRTSKAYSITTEGTHLEQSSPRLMNWGMMQNGKYLTAKITESHKTERGCSLSDILEDEGGREVFPIPRTSGETAIEVVGMLDIKGDECIRRVYSAEEGRIAPTLTTMAGGNRQPKIVQPVLTPDRLEKRQQGRRFKEPGEPAFTINTQDRHGVAIKDTRQHIDSRTGKGARVYTDVCPTINATEYKEPKKVQLGVEIRKLTPRECWRLQGFPDWAFDKAQGVNSNSQLYKQAGNSVTVNVIHAIAERLV